MFQLATPTPVIVPMGELAMQDPPLHDQEPIVEVVLALQAQPVPNIPDLNMVVAMDQDDQMQIDQVIQIEEHQDNPQAQGNLQPNQHQDDIIHQNVHIEFVQVEYQSLADLGLEAYTMNNVVQIGPCADNFRF